VQEEAQALSRIGQEEEVQEEEKALGGKMNRRLVGLALTASLSVLGLGAFASNAAATYHENLIREVHEGGVSGDYVELQSYAAGQNLVAGKHIVSYDAGGGPGTLTDYTIPSNVGNGANQATILIASTATVSGVTADFNAGVNLNVDNTGGTVCLRTVRSQSSSTAFPLMEPVAARPWWCPPARTSALHSLCRERIWTASP